MTTTLFLPGASGSATFWRPVAHAAGLDGVFLAWPGLGAEPADAGVNSVDDLVVLAASHVTEPVNIVAQSMGGIVAIRLALIFPDLVRRLVLAVTSGGVPVTDLGGSDWRADYFAAFPTAAGWIATPVPDLSESMRSIKAPTLLLWGDADPISPVPVGERLAALIPDARLRVVEGANHDLAQTHPKAVAEEVRKHLTASG
ncbi:MULTISPECIES: alpha/beta fold hydrolase [Methylorubrum]|uniref:alpha/beta fold hydrolase n=1 Tax=Methylorubrum TaxID=2282523 RepID=UPI00209EE654|nr:MULTISPECIES: alpha/beta hydrolase [Methylorubrum]MCP1551485.1 pimeloyl-ACP methyl ester carboxylesterase [Methylorubrum zatmanii]MCP1556422.1 pimeloyl-ACP methyl ester carboxylesterase [Methylorubrum extorquens]MCP1581917.1 pimeloyl-ACP methyl ester carboxylesterase [Methylorubrum extorquens]